MNWTRNFRLMGFIVLVLTASLVLLYSEFAKPPGVIVIYVGAESPCKEIITMGSIITEVAGIPIKDSADFKRVTEGIEDITTFIINDNPRICDIPKNSSLEVTVENIKKGGLSLGIDIGGGTFYLFKLEGNSLQDVLESIKSRINQYGLVNTKVGSFDNENIQIITDSEEEKYVRFLTERGSVEGGLILNVEKDEFVFNDKTYKLDLKNGKSVSINGTEYKPGQYFTLDDVKIKVENISRNVTTFFVKIFDEGDLTPTKDPANSRRLMKQDSGYVFVVPILLSEEASENFAKATKGQEIIINPATGESFLKNSLLLSIDDEEFVNLPISSQDAGKEKNELIIWGYRVRREDANNDMLRLSTLIKTKRLKTNLILKKTGSYASKSGGLFVISLLYTVLIAIVATSVAFLVKYHKKGIISLPLILVCLSEFLFILSVISLEWFVFLIFFFGVGSVLIKEEIRNWINWLAVFLMFVITIGITMSKWVLGIPSIMGLIFVLLISLGQGVFMSYQPLKKRETYTLADYRQSIDKIWLFTTIVTIIFFVLFLIGEPYREFAMTTSLGLMIATTITIPIYSSIIEKIVR
ncbi:MAG: hypothetical protein QMD36_01905 [Candidatus Aenigmarchaeota archaeon]|nr:hypothetical protein [Candidatus Aenigmarchaeota archaeon]